MNKTLDNLRSMIDEIDDQLLELLNTRAKHVLEVGALKHTNSTPVLQPQREKEILQRLSKNNTGPLSTKHLEILFRNIFKISYDLEQ